MNHDEIRARAEAARAARANIPDDDPDGLASIPADPERDSDLILAASIADVPKLLAALDAVQELCGPGKAAYVSTQSIRRLIEEALS